MLELDWGCPFLFLYSADDPLCDVHTLEELINDKRQRCAPGVELLPWGVRCPRLEVLG